MRRVTGWTGPVLVAAIAAVGAARASASPQVYVSPTGPMSSGIPGPTSNGPSLVIGQVVDGATGRPIPHAVVTLQGPGAETRMTDEKGRFYVLGLPGGDYAISASKAGYFEGAFGQRRAGGEGLPLTVLDHRWVTDVQVSLWRASVIGGFVTDEMSEPMVGVRVDALRRQNVGGEPFVKVESAVTNDQGEYRLSHLQPGDYIISVPSSTASVAGVDPSLPVSLASADRDSSETGGEAGRESVVADLVESVLRTGNVRLSADGSRMQIAHGPNPLPPGDLKFVYPTTYFPSTPILSTSLVVSVASGETHDGVNLQLSAVPSGSIAGTVTSPDGTPVANQVLRLIAAGAEDPGFNNEVAVTQSSNTGAFSFSPVPIGDYVIDASPVAQLAISAESDWVEGKPTMAFDWSVGAVTELERVGSMWGRAAVTLFDRDVTDVHVTMEPTLSVVGQVAFESATLAPPDHINAKVALDMTSIAGLEESVRHAAVDEGGGFHIAGLTRDEYFFTSGPPPPGWYLKSITSGGRDLLTTPLDLTTIGDVMDVVVTFTDKATELAGVVYDGQRPMSGATVIVFPAEPSYRGTTVLGPERVRAVRANASGTYHFVGLPAGGYYVVAIDEASADGWRTPARLEGLRAKATAVLLVDASQRYVDLQMAVKR